MSTAKSRRNKKIAAVTAAVAVAASSLLVGTLAWQSLNQTATNILVGEVNPGGRLHDDYNGDADKNIFVENFGDQNIFARIKLSEILIMGDGLKEAAINNVTGGFVANTDLIAGNDVVVGTIEDGKLIPETYIFEPGVKHGADTWIEKVWGDNNTDGYWYMPTFDKNEKSIHADLNGRANYTVSGKVIPYGDFIEWEKNTNISITSTYKISNEAYADYSQNENFENYDYDAAGNIIDYDTGDDKNGYYIKPGVHHFPDKTLATSEVITMNDWLLRKYAYDVYMAQLGATPEQYNKDHPEAPITGNFWVFDPTTEYFYWAQPIEPDANDLVKSEENLKNTTGLLVDKLRKTGRLDQDHYYELIVDADFVTVDDLLYADENTAGRGFHTSDTGVTSAAIQNFLKTIGAAVDEEAFTYVLDVTKPEHHIPYGSKIQLTGFEGVLTKVSIVGLGNIILVEGKDFGVTPVEKTIQLIDEKGAERLFVYVTLDGNKPLTPITIYLGDAAAPTTITP